jgi:hypothetical protein
MKLHKAKTPGQKPLVIGYITPTAFEIAPAY